MNTGCYCIHYLPVFPIQSTRFQSSTTAPSPFGNAGLPLPAESRRAFFGRQENRAGRTFATDMVWTFYFYQHLLDLPKYSLNLLHK